MKYLCLICNDEKVLQAMPKAAFDDLCDQHLAYEEELRRHGQFVAADALQSVQTATVVRVRDGKISVTDGPFAETREQIGGFFVIEAGDLNEAIRVAAGIPSARTGCIEVRPIRELNRKN